MDFAIEMESLSRRFGRIEALHDLTLAVPQGSVFAYVGPNGAGKTTTIKAFMNILEPSSGRAFVLGTDSRRLGPRQFEQIGYVSENQELPEWMHVGELLRYCARMYPTWDESLCQKLLERFDLNRDRKISSLSRGMKMKVALLSSLSYRPRLLVMDEPFGGMDPLVRDELIRAVLELSGEEGWTLFISSHDIDEVERLADWIGILDHGRLHLAEPVASILARFREIEVVMEGEPPETVTPPKTWLLVEKAARTIRFVHTSYAEESAESEIRSVLPGARRVMASAMSLKDIFVTLGRAFRLTEA
jgi:ABC-2 type transport system ATP-binding protein